MMPLRFAPAKYLFVVNLRGRQGKKLKDVGVRFAHLKLCTFSMNVKSTCARENSDGPVGRKSAAPYQRSFLRRNAPHDSKAVE
jgi:hypothetical protein